MKRILPMFLSLAVLVNTGCLTVEGLKTLASAPQHIETAVAVTSSLSGAMASITDEEEYYIGRAVAARILEKYELVDNRKLLDYVNLVGNTVALHSQRPFTVGGYHFAVIKSDEINAFACPGGVIFITTGMINLLHNEDELATVLAHEISHVSTRDGLSAIKSSRWTEVVAVIGSSAIRQYSSEELANLARLFDGTIDDIFKTIVVNGYSRSQEYAADKNSLVLLASAGYDPNAMKSFLNSLIRKSASSQGGILQTHPSTVERVDIILSSLRSISVSDNGFIQARLMRFSEALQ